MKEILFIYPNSLFENNELIKKNKFSTIYLLEHPLYFTTYLYHKMKLVLHRASMKYYKDYIEKKYKQKVQYIEYSTNFTKLYKECKGFTIHTYDPIEHTIDFKTLEKKYGLKFVIHETPLFLNTDDDLNNYIKKTNKISHSDFYKSQRILHDILMENSKPIGDTWSLDTENRKPFPKNIKLKDDIPVLSNNKYIKDAIIYVEEHFSKNPGSPNLYLPIDFNGAKKQLSNFIKTKLDNFGPYEDAVNKNINFGYHSVLSPLINIGLITPKYIINEIKKIKITKSNLASVEGYIRQIIGWREYCRLMYVYKKDELEKPNYFEHDNSLAQGWYKDNQPNLTGFEVINHLVEKTLKYGYLHHIERLMYIGNFMMLTRIKPKDVFDWFQSMFLDSYHVFMYPNVYGMSQHSCGPIMMNRPYFSSSSYIARMSDFKKGTSIIKINNITYDWDVVWDALYYNFINNNVKKFEKNYAIANQVKNWKNTTNKKEILLVCKNYLENY